MRWLQTIVMVGALAAGASAAQQRVVSEAATEERVAGLLDLPGILGDIQCQQFQPKTISYYSRPSKDGAPAGTIEVRLARLPDQPQCYQPTAAVRRAGSNSQTEELPTEESGYEVQAAVVFEHRGNWFRIALQRGFAWIERENLEGFLPYPAGLASDSHLTYLRQEWDGKLWSVPGSATALTAPTNWLAYRDRQLPVRVLSTRTIGRDVWIQIKFETEEVCGQTLDKVTPLEGWIPAYRPDGATSVWFYSRGC
jgi:hypothetical protein